MKLKDNIINNEYDNAFPFDREFTDWVNCVDYEYNEADNVPALKVTERTVLHLDNGEFSPFATVNS